MRRKKNERKVAVQLVENGEIINLRIIAEAIAEKIKNGGIQL